MQMKNAGSIASTVRRAGPGRSTGKNRCSACSWNRSRTTEAPVSVTVVMTSGSDG
jgi:hypothetical protein